MEVSIRACDEDEALEILCCPSVIKLLSVQPEGIGADWMKLIMGGKLLVLAKPEGDEVEVHIACAYRDRGDIRGTMIEGLKWFTEQGYQRVWTTAPDSRKALVKMLQSLQFRKVGSRWVYEH
jgi:hypothetical protein